VSASSSSGGASSASGASSSAAAPSASAPAAPGAPGAAAPARRPRTAWLDDRLPILPMLARTLRDFPEPKNLSYLWNFGSLAGITLVIMILSGIVLATHYTPHVDHAFDSVDRIMRDVNHGWLIRYIHSNGASFFFLVVFIHMFRGLYYGSFKRPREVLWILGVVLFILMMATAFMGYVLPWGQMSFWGATVITNLFSSIPIFGEGIVEWLWGGFSVGNPTLNRFFALHYLFPFLIVGVVVLHIWALHHVGSNNPLGIDTKEEADSIPFHPYYTYRDLLGLAAFLLVFSVFVFFAPNYLGHPDNYIPADPLSTPAHIVPEWYFLPFYAMLRAITFDIGIPFTGIVFIDAKLGGVLTMFGAVLVLFALPWLDRSPVRSGRFRPLFRVFFWIFAATCLVLGYVGAKPADASLLGVPLQWIGLLGTAYYYAFFLVLLPVVIPRLEKTRPLPDSIAEAFAEAKGRRAR